jgi:hypothetical protein
VSSQLIYRLNAIQFTAKRECDTRFHLLQNATVKNIIDCKTRRVTRFLNRFLFRVINSLLLLTAKSDSVIDCKSRIFKCDFIIDCKTRILLLTEQRAFKCICKTSIIDCKTRILLLTEQLAFKCICKTSIIDCKARFLSIIQLYLQNASHVHHANGHSLG